MNGLVLLISFLLLFVLELIYLQTAKKINITDNPNHRSSHTTVTIRGGGIIFSLALLLGSLYIGWDYIYFLVGLFLISLISFIDDIKTINNRIRIIFHLIAVALLFYQVGIYHMPIPVIMLGIFIVIGSINAVNFMDGINGMTGGFGLITLLTLYYINRSVTEFTDSKYLILSIASLMVFNFFNFRKVAKCFAGDVGSVSLAFIILFFLLQLILKTNNLNYLLLLLIYGLDTVTTILFRMLRKENVFEAHRTHFYQFLVNKKKISHVVVSVSYAIVQGVINVLILIYLPASMICLFVSLMISAIVFVSIRLYMEGFYEISKGK